MESKITRGQVTALAISYAGTPFVHGARLPGAGLDCIGVVVCLARHFAIPHSDLTAYPMRPNGMLKPMLDQQLVRVYREPQEGDVLLMTFGGQPHHVAVMVDGSRIVHAYQNVEKCVVQSYTKNWRAKVRAVYEFPGVE
jgi:cell wall-associated NlpC family hydrolase